MQFCHIAPTEYIPLVAHHPRHLLLAHLVESDEAYVQQYLKIKEENPNSLILMDNSAFEFHKKGLPMLESDKLIELGKKCKADYIVLSDYPEERWTKTYFKGLDMADEIHEAGFKTFYVPQSCLGDLEGYMDGLKHAIDNVEKFDLIGLSIIGCPTALNLKENKYGEQISGSHRMQRYLSRFRIFEEMEDRGWFDDYELMQKLHHRFHCLGMVEGPKEIRLLERWGFAIASWDSSSAVWHGLNGIRYDQSPTGLINGKLESEVDFGYKWADVKPTTVNDIMYNVGVIDKLAERYGCDEGSCGSCGSANGASATAQPVEQPIMWM